MRVAGEALLWLVSRAGAIAVLLLPNGYYIPSDLTVFAGWAEDLASGVPITSPLWQYPPGVAVLLGFVGWIGGGIWPILALIIAADAAVQYVLRRSPGAILWAVAPLFVGPIMLTRLEPVVTLTAILGLGIGATRSGAWLGLGASLKLWPAILALRLRDGLVRRSVAAAVAFSAAALTAGLFFQAPAFLSNQVRRGLQVESVAAWPFMVARALGAPIPLVTRNGSMEINSPVADSIAAVLLPLALLIATSIAIWAWRVPGASEIGTSALVALAIVLALMLTSRVLSPQFIVWPIGLLALALRDGRGPHRITGCLLGSAALGLALYPFAYVDFLTRGWVGLAIQTGRLGLLVAAATFAWQAIRPPSALERPASSARVGHP